MWQSIYQQLNDVLGQEQAWSAPQPVGGSQQHFHLSGNAHHLFIKLSSRKERDRLEAEYRALQILNTTPCPQSPQPLLVGSSGKRSFIAMQYIDLVHHGDWAQLGAAIAKFHASQEQRQYGWQEDNFIGPTPQKNAWHNNWAMFFAEQRVGFMLQLLKERGVEFADIQTVVSNVHKLLSGHQPAASPLHGDLWSGNVGFYQQQAFWFDPAFYFGDRETDIAMAELFGGFPPAFFTGYNQQWPLTESYQWRKPVYQLYHLLNHCLLFGDSYHSATTLIIDNLQ